MRVLFLSVILALRVLFPSLLLILLSCSLGYVKDTDNYTVFDFHLTGQINKGLIFFDYFGIMPIKPLFYSDLKGVMGAGIYTIPFPENLRSSGVILPAFGFSAGFGAYTYAEGVFLAPSIEANLRSFGKEDWQFGMLFIRGRAFTVIGEEQRFIFIGFILDFGFRVGLPPSILESCSCPSCYW